VTRGWRRRGSAATKAPEGGTSPRVTPCREAACSGAESSRPASTGSNPVAATTPYRKENARDRDSGIASIAREGRARSRFTLYGWRTASGASDPSGGRTARPTSSDLSRRRRE